MLAVLPGAWCVVPTSTELRERYENAAFDDRAVPGDETMSEVLNDAILALEEREQQVERLARIMRRHVEAHDRTSEQFLDGKTLEDMGIKTYTGQMRKALREIEQDGA